MISNYLSEKQSREILKSNVSIYEKVVVTMTLIQKINPEARFTSQEIADFLGKTPKGITTMFKAIKLKYPAFPAHMLSVKTDEKNINPSVVEKLQMFLEELDHITSEEPNLSNLENLDLTSPNELNYNDIKDESLINSQAGAAE